MALTDKQRDILLFVEMFNAEWVDLAAARSAGVIVTADDRGELDWLVGWEYLRLYDDNRPEFAVGLTDAGRAALSRYRTDALDSAEGEPA
ncbi:hypothetical protein ABNQ39_20440 [Azospirillum sp. A26]|uniref:hypothetical protein n=1 Tax=Azospirillum sp. A26 TaxID=3160607 RepID=UPI00366DFC9B